MNRRSIILSVFALNVLLVTYVRADASAVKLSEHRWREHAYGISLRPPADAEIFERVVNDPIPWTLGHSGKPHEVSLRELGGAMNLAPIREKLAKGVRNQGVRDLLAQVRGRTTISPQMTGRILQHITEDAMIRIVGGRDYTISVSLKKAKEPMTVRDVINASVQKVGGTYPAAHGSNTEYRVYAGRPGGLVYFKIPIEKGNFRVIGLMVMQIDPVRFLMMRLDSDQPGGAKVTDIFEAVCDSLMIDDPGTLDMQRTLAIDRGKLWRKTIDFDKLCQTLTPAMLMRIADKRSDVGYITINQQRITDKVMNVEGIEVKVQARVLEGEAWYDSIGTFFVSRDGNFEQWSIRTTARPVVKVVAGSAPSLVTWTQTGMRNYSRLQIINETPSGVERNAWDSLPDGYLSQVELHLIHALLPRDNNTTFGFYAFHPTGGQITYRTVRVAQLSGGGYQLYTRPTPALGETMAQYDANAQLVGYQLAGGRMMLPIDPATFRRVFGKQ